MERNSLIKATKVINHYRDPWRGDNRLPTLREFNAGFFGNTWYVVGWNNVHNEQSSSNERPFQGTTLAKGLVGKLLAKLGFSWEIGLGFFEDVEEESKRVFCSRVPYCVANRSIYLHLEKKTLDHLYKNNLDKFKTTYTYLKDRRR